MAEDPVQSLKAAHLNVAPLVDAFSFLAVMTSFIGFFLGLADFFQDLLPKSEDGEAAKVQSYALAAIPPYLIAITFPDIFMAALDKVRPISRTLLLSFARCEINVAIWTILSRKRPTTSAARHVQAGTYGVLVLFGILPAAMVWSERYGKSTLTQIRVVPGGRAMLIGSGGVAAAVVADQLVKLVSEFT